MTDLITYTKFFTLEDADPLLEILKKEGITYEIEKETNPLDSVYFGNDLSPMFAIKIPRDQFSKLNYILEESAGESIQHADEEYYLYDFSNEELNAVITDVEEWNAYDRELAQKILLERNAQIPNPKSKPYQPEELNLMWVIVGYLWVTTPAVVIIVNPLNPFAYFLLTPLTGIFFGLGLVTAKKTLPNGERRPMYNRRTIRHGYGLIVIGAIVFTLFILRASLNWRF